MPNSQASDRRGGPPQAKCIARVLQVDTATPALYTLDRLGGHTRKRKILVVLLTTAH